MPLKQSAKEVACRVVHAARGSRADRMEPGISILTYHSISASESPLSLSIRPELFESQMRMLSERFEVVHLSDALESLRNGTLVGRKFAVTFDDGYLDNYTIAYPILRRYRIPAVLFVCVEAVDTGHFHWERFDRAVLETRERRLDWSSQGFGVRELGDSRQRASLLPELHAILKRCDDAVRRSLVESALERFQDVGTGERTMLSWEQVKEMEEGGFVRIGSHTMSHPILSRLTRPQKEREIVDSRDALALRLGHPPDLFAYPNGKTEDFDRETVEILASAGYRAACSTVSGINRVGCDPYRLNRIDVNTKCSTGASGRFSPEMFSVYVNRGLGRLFSS